MSGKPLCALCLTQPAELYCKNDDANLCIACDVTYHSSNPLANRHERIPLPQCLNESCSSAILPASSLAESDGDLAVVPEYKPSGDLQFGDTMFGANGLAGSSLNSGLNTADLFDMNGGGNGFLDFDLNDLLDFSTPDDDSHTMAQHEHMIKNEDVSIFDAMVPSLDASVSPAANLSSAQAAPAAYNGLSASFMSSQAAFTMPQATMLPYSQEAMLHMVPQLQPAPSQNFSPLIPVPSSGGPAPGGAAKLVSTTSAQQHQKQAEFEAAKHQCAMAGGAAPAVPTEVPLTRAERVARYLEKKKRRNFKKVIRYQSRKAYAEVRPRIKGRFATPAEVAAMKAAEAAKLAAAHAPDMDDVAVVPAC